MVQGIQLSASTALLYDLSGSLKPFGLNAQTLHGSYCSTAIALLSLYKHLRLLPLSAFSGATEGRSWATSLLSLRQNPGERPQALLGLGAESVLRLLY